MKNQQLETMPLSTLAGIGLRQAEKLAKMGLMTVWDLLLHLPLRYEDRTRLYRIDALSAGMTATVSGEISNSSVTAGRRRMLTVHMNDGSGILALRFFNFNQGMKNSLVAGRRILVWGEIKFARTGLECIHPEYHFYNNADDIQLEQVLTPVYSVTEGIRQATLRKFIDSALILLDVCTPAELLPPEISGSFINLPQAIHRLHHPPADAKLTELTQGKYSAKYRLVMEELLAHTLSMLVIRNNIQHHAAQVFTPDEQLKQIFLASLPFTLTAAQQRVITEIEQDLAKSIPMMRLLQGDVGSGKTLVAAMAALSVIAQGKQVALMAPTELLAEQHASTFRQWFTPLGVETACLAGKQKGMIRFRQQQAIAQGDVLLVVGTHALFQQQIRFLNLALIIIDEQHRFGVHQRLTLWEKGREQGFCAHQLIMTATPIPRTLAMMAYADLDTSVIDELPQGRTPVSTVAIADSRRHEVIQRVRNACLQEGRQVYWLCTLIEESELLDAQAAQLTCEELRMALPEIRTGLIHGRMKADEKQAVMQAFKQGTLQLLVATTVIEVGVDVPNASLMIIDNPERLGLAQLHQLRGRVGRGTKASHCVLLYKTPLSKTAQMRLQVLRETSDGFTIAERDLEIRGPGELLGTRQTGNVPLKVADLLRYQAMIPEIQRAALYIQQHYPRQAEALIERWLPDSTQYTRV